MATTPQPSNRHLAANVTLRNRGPAAVQYTALYFKAKDADARDCSTPLTLTGAQQLTGAALNPVERTRGRVVFEVPTAVHPVKLVYQPLMETTRVIAAVPR